MNDLKWEKTEIGKGSILDVEFGKIKSSVLVDTDGADSLIKLLNALSHKIDKTNEENEKIMKELEKTTLSESAVPIIQDTIKNLVSIVPGYAQILEQKSAPVDVQTTLDNDNGFFEIDYELDNPNDVINMIRAYKILGFNKYDTIKLLGKDVDYWLRLKGLSWKKLGTSEDHFYKVFFEDDVFEASSYVTERHRKIKDDIFSSHLKFIRMESPHMSLNEIAKSIEVLPAYVWAVCMFKHINFSIYNRVHKRVETYTFTNRPDSKRQRAYNKIKARGGIDALKKCRAKGMKQVEVGAAWNVPIVYISQFIDEHGERWIDWPKNQS